MNKYLSPIYGLFAGMKVARLLGRSFEARDRGDLTSAIDDLEKAVEIRTKYPDDVTYQVATEELFNHYLKQDKADLAIDRGLLSFHSLLEAEHANLSLYESLANSKRYFLAQLYAILSRERPDHPDAELLKTIIQRYEKSTN